ncbi:glycosyltransferase family 4 protein [Spirosoma agri]|uniref:Glycosyltransferase family 4 protein n=1 Tax=Spirosoma agri TaxID=1987381 RepID=A0A6M0IKH3_9BACT|nr:glycosyltransferase family 4 protein [Spirosoma agri]NEU67443.1 glycosyltransferase family 4 protein [Spirosoma agri]
MRKIIISHPTGNANVRATTNYFAQVDILANYHTTIALFNNDPLDRLGKIQYLSEIKRRRYDQIIKLFTITHPFREFARLLLSKTRFRNLIQNEHSFFSIDSVYKNLDKSVAKSLRRSLASGPKSVYAYDDGALFSFREAKRLGIPCLFDLPTGHWRAAKRLLEVERERWPDWIATMPSYKDSPEKLANKDEELSLADQIFVASQFTAQTLHEFPGLLAPVHVIPYGFPPVCTPKTYWDTFDKNKLKLLFVGKLSQQKGIADLFAAVEGLTKQVTLTVVGNKVTNDCPALDKALLRHKWIPSLPHPEILQLMREHDVLVFPSLFDGFGLVITEAMSQGTPVIASNRCAGPDLIEHGQNGWLVEAASIQSLRTAIENLLSDPKQIGKAGKAALETARKRPWAVYGRELVEAIESKYIAKPIL